MNAPFIVQAPPVRSLEAEQALIGAVLINNDAFHAVSDIIAAHHFSEPIHGHLWQAIADKISAGGRADVVLLAERLANEDLVEGMTVGAYVARLAASAVTIVNAPDFAAAIVESWQRSCLVSIGQRLAVEATDRAFEAQSIDDIIGSTEDAIRKVQDTTTRVDSVRLIDAAGEAMAKAMEAKDRRSSVTGITSGLADLDKLTGGWQPGDLIIIGARPSMGKSTFGLNLGRAAAQVAHGAAFFSLEMPNRQCATRVITDIAFDHGKSVAYQDILHGSYDDTSYPVIERAVGDMRRLPLMLNDGPQSIVKLSAAARRLRDSMERDGGVLSLVVVDYLQLIKAADRYRGDRNNEVSEISAGLKELAKTLNVAVIALSQLSRSLESRQDKRPMLSDLRDSGSLEQDADVVMFLYREVYYLERQGPCEDPGQEFDRQALINQKRNVLEAIVAKNRNGPTDTAHLFIDIAASAVRNLTHGDR
jgi:replicative DNA helicase